MAKTDTVADLNPNPQNPRQVSDAKLKQLRRALEQFGDMSGVVLNRRTGHLVGGHMRSRVLPKKAPILLDETYREPTKAGTVALGHIVLDGERLSYRVVDWPESVERAAALAANKNAGDWDMGLLTSWVTELKAADFDLDLTMFSPDELAALLPTEVPAEEVPEATGTGEPPAEPRTKPGDVWVLGAHRLMCGDSSNVQHVDALLAGDKVNMVYTDPPYGMRLDTDYKQLDTRNGDADRKKKYGVKTARNKHRPVHGDDEDYDPTFLLGYFHQVPEIFMWGADYYCQHLPKDGSWVVWDKRSKADDTQLGDFHGAHFELCWSKAKHQRLICRHLWAGLYQATNEKYVHPTQKPVAVAQWFLERWGKAGDVVVDLYGGSGSTLLACEKTGRVCRTLEIDPGYVEVIISRWQQLTGQQAVLQG